MRDMYWPRLGSEGKIYMFGESVTSALTAQKFLGRAKEVSEFVKHGAKEAMVEIELAKDGKRFKRNIIIRCIIKREANKATYSVNGESKSKKAAVELARSLSIQIDNLCQFLPQDKVVEFAAMTPIELLRSTERAVASQEMIDKHEELKEQKKGQKAMQMKIDEDQSILNNLEGRHRLQEADVERMREREKVVKKVEYLEAARPFADYREARAAHTEASQKKKDAQRELNQLRNEIEPSLTAVNDKKQYKNEIAVVAKERKQAVEKAAEKADKIDRDFQALHDQDKALEQQRSAEKKGGQKHRSDIARINGNIDRLKKQIEDPPAEVDTATYNEKIRERQRAVDACEIDIRDAQNQQRNLNQQGIERKQRIERAERELGQLDSQVGKQNTKLANASHETYKAWQWLQDNPNEFEKQVFGPPIVECAVKDHKYVDHIEALFQRGLLLSFTVQTKNDFKKLSDKLHDHLHLSEVNIKTIEFGMERFRAPLSPEEMKRFGFEGWALDYMQAPEPVLAMLCAEIKIHETGISVQDQNQQQFDIITRSNLTSWVTSKNSYRITRRREYGAGAISTQVKVLRKANVWTDQPVDFTAKRELQESIDGWKDELKSLAQEIEELKRTVRMLRDKHTEYRNEGVCWLLSTYQAVGADYAQKALSDEKQAKQQARAAFSGLPTKLGRSRRCPYAVVGLISCSTGRIEARRLPRVYGWHQGPSSRNLKATRRHCNAKSRTCIEVHGKLDAHSHRSEAKLTALPGRRRQPPN